MTPPPLTPPPPITEALPRSTGSGPFSCHVDGLSCGVAEVTRGHVWAAEVRRDGESWESVGPGGTVVDRPRGEVCSLCGAYCRRDDTGLIVLYVMRVPGYDTRGAPDGASR